MSAIDPDTPLPNLPPEVIMQMAAGYMFDQWATMNNLIKELKIRVNAGHATRSQLELLNEQLGGIYQALQTIISELKEIKAMQATPAPATPSE